MVLIENAYQSESKIKINLFLVDFIFFEAVENYRLLIAWF